MKLRLQSNVAGLCSSIRSQRRRGPHVVKSITKPTACCFSTRWPFKRLPTSSEITRLSRPKVRHYGRLKRFSDDVSTLQATPWQDSSHRFSLVQGKNFSSSPCARLNHWGKAEHFASHAFPSKDDGNMRYIIALGSNVGDRFDMIERACRAMDEAGVHVTCTSGLWQTKAMYVEEQDDFLNGVCMVKTRYDPVTLMRKLQSIENELGRVKVIDKGPRSIDLDILLWEKGSFRSMSPDLTIPHNLMHEREFTLAPLSQIVGSSFETPTESNGLPLSFVEMENSRTFYSMLQQLQRQQPDDAPKMRTQIPFSKGLPALVPSLSSKRTHVMAILNLTPDSFSDGGKHAYDDPGYLRSTIQSHLSAGATIIDVGGQSSRPGAKDISAGEEITRITPALQILAELRKDSSVSPFAISVDTYRASVAEAAVGLGADIVNDISAGTLDPDMLPTVARLGCTYVLMHMRGTPSTMSSKQHTTYARDIIHEIKSEMIQHLIRAQKAGIRRWRIILDPGVGFAKAGAQNTEILRRLPELLMPADSAVTSASGSEAGGESRVGDEGIVEDGAFYSLHGMPWLLGTSRKRFIGKILGVDDASDRQWGTAATVAASIAGGADIVRVHDVKEMAQVARMSDVIWRV